MEYRERFNERKAKMKRRHKQDKKNSMKNIKDKKNWKKNGGLHREGKEKELSQMKKIREGSNERGENEKKKKREDKK